MCTNAITNKKCTLHDMVNDNRLQLISGSNGEKIQQLVDSGALDEALVLDTFAQALSVIHKSRQVVKDIRRAIATIIVEQDALPAHQQGCSLRVVGTLLHDALDWSRDIVVPEALQSAKEKIAITVRCGGCGAKRPRNSCACHNAYYCSRACQVKGWSSHKKVCEARNSK